MPDKLLSHRMCWDTVFPVPSTPVNTKPDRVPRTEGSCLHTVAQLGTAGHSWVQPGLARAKLALHPGTGFPHAAAGCHTACGGKGCCHCGLQSHSQPMAQERGSVVDCFSPFTFLERGVSTRQALRSRTVSQESWAPCLPLPWGTGPSHSPGRCLAHS